MKLRLLIIALLLILPMNVMAIFELTKSADLEKGTSHYFSRADTASLSITGDVSLEAWIKIETHDDNHMIIAKQDGAGWSWKMFINSGGFLQGNLQNGSGSSNAIGTATDFTGLEGTWVHVAMSFNSSNGNIDLFVNGSAEAHSGTTGARGAFDNNHTIRIGAQNSTPAVFFDGRISLLRVWSSQRTESEINDNKCNVLGATANLAAEWTLDDTVDDNSGNGNTLTNNNSVPFVIDITGDCPIVGPEVIITPPQSVFWFD